MQTVIKVIAEHLDVAESKVTPEAHLVDDLGVKISEDDGDKVQTVQDLINLVEKK